MKLDLLPGSPGELLWWLRTGGLPLRAAVTTREGGVSHAPYDSLNLGFHVEDDPLAVDENRRRAMEAFGAGTDRLVTVEQVHGAEVATVDGMDAGTGAVGRFDAMVTNDPEVVLAILAADCVPVIAFDPVARVLGVAHAGWKGLAAGVVGATVRAMARIGAQPGRTVAGLGPSIGLDRYEVGGEVVEALDASVLASPPGAVRVERERAHVNLAAFAATQLAEAGVPSSSVAVPSISTGSPGPFFSDREARPCGRFALLARLLTA